MASNNGHVPRVIDFRDEEARGDAVEITIADAFDASQPLIEGADWKIYARPGDRLILRLRQPGEK